MRGQRIRKQTDGISLTVDTPIPFYAILNDLAYVVTNRQKNSPVNPGENAG